jgi:hypothetical protein
MPVPDLAQNPDPGPAPIPITVLNPRTYGERECNDETGKTEAFADDNTVLALLDNEALNAIREILNKFADISGLKCNVDKSLIMICGTDEIPAYVAESGFQIADSLTILGFQI